MNTAQKGILLGTWLAALALSGCAGDAPKNQALNTPNCIRDTGTRIEHDGCTGDAGRSYTREDIERTGAMSTGQAIQQLDPSARPR